jgi:hypothetical protein
MQVAEDIAAQPLLETERFLYEVLTPSLGRMAQEIIADSFADEPCAIHLNSRRDERYTQFLQFSKYFWEECCVNGLSVACKDKVTGTLCGVFWCKDFKSESSAAISVDELDCIAPVVKVIDVAELAYQRLHPGLELGQCAHMWMLGVSPGYRGQGLSNVLTALTKELALSKGYSHIVLESSGAFSAHCAKKAGFREVATFVYEDIEPLLAGMPEMHSKLIVWEHFTP